MFQAMKDYWWLILVEGVIAVIFGVFVLLNPAISAVSLVVAFGVYAVASGGMAHRTRRRSHCRGRNYV